MFFAGTLRWRHNRRDSVYNHQPHDCWLNRLFRCRSKKTSKLRVTGLCVGNLPGRTCEFPAQMASNAKMFPFNDVIMNTTKWNKQYTYEYMQSIPFYHPTTNPHNRVNYVTFRRLFCNITISRSGVNRDIAYFEICQCMYENVFEIITTQTSL